MEGMPEPELTDDLSSNSTTATNSPNTHMSMDMGGMGMGMAMNGSMDMMMMYFHKGIREYILFEGLHTYNDLGFAWACIVIFFAAMLYEALKYARENIAVRHNLRVAEVMMRGSHEEKTRIKSVGGRMFSRIHLLQTSLHAVQILLSYCLMLIFMTYNVWLCISLVLGATIGYFVTGWQRMTVHDQNEHCH